MRKRNRFDEPMIFDHIELEPENTILGIVAEPDIADCSDQVLSKEVINEAMILFNTHFGNVLIQHKDSRGREPDFTQVANIQTLDNWGFTFNDRISIKNSFVTSEDSLISSMPVRSGTWLMELEIKDEAIQEKIDKGILNGLSYGGAGCPVSVNSHKQILSLLPAEVSLVNKACNRRGWLRKAEAIRKPFISEFSCRLPGGDPDNFQKDSFRRMSRESGGKRLDIIIARPKGSTKTREQAYRYPLEAGWTTEASQAHCKRHKGAFHDIKREEE